MRKSTGARRKLAQYGAAPMAPAAFLPAEVATRRVRAAVAFSLKDQSTIEAELRVVTPATFKRIVGRGQPRGASVEELWDIAAACGVPRRFMEEGFEPLEQQPGNDAELQRQVKPEPGPARRAYWKIP